MDPSNPRDAGDRGRRDRRDGKRTQDNRSRSRPARHEAASNKHGSRTHAEPDGIFRFLKPLKRESRRRKVLDEAYLTETPGVLPMGQRERLAMAHAETKAELPRLLSQVNMGGGVSAQMLATQHKVYTPRTLKQPDPALCPGLPSVVIRVTREDTLTAAIRLAQEASAAATAAASAATAAKAADASKTAKERKSDKDDDRSSVSLSVSTSSTSSSPEMPKYPLIINFANRDHPGGGWTYGAMAQEEAVFYRSSLSLSLDPKIYPLAHNSIVYSPCVFVIREEFSAGHKLLKPETFPVISAVTVAALQRPGVRTVRILKRGQAENAETPPTKKAALPLGQLALRSHAQPTSNKSTTAAATSLLPSMRPSRRTQDAAASDTFFSLRESPRPSPEMIAAGTAIASAMLTGSSPFMPATATPLPSPTMPPRPSPEMIAAGTALASAGLSALHSTELFASRPTGLSALRPTKLHAPPPAVAPLSERLIFADKLDRTATKTKMRLVLRAAAAHGHQQLVLGALGCGVFGNPPEDVARCWLEVLREKEFIVEDPSGGESKHWWKDVVFAVYEKPKRPDGKWVKPDAIDGDGDDGEDDTDDNSNYEIFRRVLDGKSV